MSTLSEMLGENKGSYPRAADMLEWQSYTTSVAAGTYPDRRPVGCMVPVNGSYELELIKEDGTTENVSVTLVAGAQYEISNLARVRAGAATVVHFYMKN